MKTYTATSYSKQPFVIPDGIVVTFGREMIAEKGGLLSFIRWFESILSEDDSYWMHKCKNRPIQDHIQYVYVIICNRVYYRCFYGGYQTSGMKAQSRPGGPMEYITYPRIILAGPLVKAPRKIIRRGFQGFQYTTKLF